MTRKLRTFYTTEAVAELVGMSGTNARNRIASGEWKPSAQTSSGKALFSEAAVSQIAAREAERAARRAQATGPTRDERSYLEMIAGSHDEVTP